MVQSRFQITLHLPTESHSCDWFHNDHFAKCCLLLAEIHSTSNTKSQGKCEDKGILASPMANAAVFIGMTTIVSL